MMTKEEKKIAKRMKIWEFCLDKNWFLKPGPNSCLHFLDSKKRLSRLDFQDKDDLILMSKVKVDPNKEGAGRNYRWIILQQAKYIDVAIKESGLEFKQAKKKNKKRKGKI